MNPGLADHERGNREARRFSETERHYDNLTPDDPEPYTCRTCECATGDVDDSGNCPKCREVKCPTCGQWGRADEVDEADHCEACRKRHAEFGG